MLQVLSDLYYLQLKEGCISLGCNHPYCKSSSNFLFVEDEDDSLRAKANDLAKNHKNENKLCPNFPHTLYNFSIFDKVIIFNDFLNSFSKNTKINNQTQIADIISNSECYPFLFSYDLNEYDFNSICPPQELIRDFIQAVKQNPKGLSFLSTKLNNTITNLISKSSASENCFKSLSHIRAIFISFMFFDLLSSNVRLLFNLIAHVMSLVEAAHLLLVDMFSKSPLLINEVNCVAQKALSDYVESKKFKIDDIVWNVSKFIHFILSAANDKSGNTINHHSFANNSLSKRFQKNRELRRYISLNPSLLYTSSVISVIKKSKLIPEGCALTSSSHLVLPTVNSTFTLNDFEMHKEEHPIPKLAPSRGHQRRQRRRSNSDDEDSDEEDSDDITADELLNLLEDLVSDIHDQYTGNDEEEDNRLSSRDFTYSYDNVGGEEYNNLLHSRNVKKRRQARLDIEVHRDNLLDDTLRALLVAEHTDLFGKLSVKFIGEDGVDAGGVSREFFTLVTNKIFSPDYGMFELIDNKFYWFRNENFDMERYFTLLGAFIGIAINNKVILPIRFPNILYKKLMKTKDCVFDLNDLDEIDHQAAESLRSMLSMKENGDNVEDAGMMFEINIDYFGSLKVIELIENGSNTPVTNDNVEDYIQKYIDWKLNKSIEKQFSSFKEGYNLVCKTPIMEIFHPSELSELVSGIETLDWNSFKKATILKGFKKDSKTIIDLWYLLDNEWNEDQRINFLYFITGSKTAPVGGLGNLHIKIEKISTKNLLPVAHTCFNRLDLPDYSDRKLLKQKLAICLENCEGFGFK